MTLSNIDAHPFGPHRNRFNQWKPREKPHLKPPQGVRATWQCVALVGASSYYVEAETASQACTAMLAKQESWWDGVTHGRSR